MGILLTRRCTAWTCSDYHHSDFVGYIDKYEYLCHKKFKAKDNQVFIILWHRTKYIVQYMCQLLFNRFYSDLYICRIRIVISNFLSTYQLPLRILSTAVLLFALYSVHKRITKNCVVNFDNIKKTNRSL